jgi:hypothetical protein
LGCPQSFSGGLAVSGPDQFLEGSFDLQISGLSPDISPHLLAG